MGCEFALGVFECFGLVESGHGCAPLYCDWCVLRKNDNMFDIGCQAKGMPMWIEVAYAFGTFWRDSPCEADCYYFDLFGDDGFDAPFFYWTCSN